MNGSKHTTFWRARWGFLGLAALLLMLMAQAVPAYGDDPPHPAPTAVAVEDLSGPQGDEFCPATRILRS